MFRKIARFTIDILNRRLAQFRQDYRLERKVFSDISLEDDSYSSSHRHAISRVVVLHNDKLETFFSPVDGSSDDFFDNESFWSGSLTWY